MREDMGNCHFLLNGCGLDESVLNDFSSRRSLGSGGSGEKGKNQRGKGEIKRLKIISPGTRPGGAEGRSDSGTEECLKERGKKKSMFT